MGIFKRLAQGSEAIIPRDVTGGVHHDAGCLGYGDALSAQQSQQQQRRQRQPDR
jgi:hypothetical protein